MSEGLANLDAHAYVDDSLSPSDRVAFEAALRRDPKLRARVEAWEAQNEAIRLAFGAAPRPRHSALARPSNENNAKAAERRASTTRGRADAPRADTLAPRSRWLRGAVGGLAFVAAALSFAGGPADPREALMRRANAALRASAAFADTRLDFVSEDSVAVAAWLSPRFARLDSHHVAPPGWSLLGVRIVPGGESSAALVLYEDALGGRAGLLLEPTDALPPLAPIGERDADLTTIAGAERGFAYAAVGPTRSGVRALIPVAAN